MSKARKSSVDPVRRPLTKAHIPYRADDLTHGKKTGVTVREVDRRSDGFEPFGELLTQADGLTPPNARTKRRRRFPSLVPEVDENGEMSMDLDDCMSCFNDRGGDVKMSQLLVSYYSKPKHLFQQCTTA